MLLWWIPLCSQFFGQKTRLLSGALQLLREMPYSTCALHASKLTCLQVNYITWSCIRIAWLDLQLLHQSSQQHTVPNLSAYKKSRGIKDWAWLFILHSCSHQEEPCSPFPIYLGHDPPVIRVNGKILLDSKGLWNTFLMSQFHHTWHRPNKSWFCLQPLVLLYLFPCHIAPF